MPMYEYKCSSCKETFTIMQRMGAGVEGLSCPACRGTELSKLISHTFSHDSSKALPADFEAQAAKMSKAMAASPCSQGMCGGAGNTCSIKDFGPAE